MITRDSWPNLPKKALIYAQELADDYLPSLNNSDESVTTAIWLAFFWFFLDFVHWRSAHIPRWLWVCFLRAGSIRQVLTAGRGDWNEMGAGKVPNEGGCLSV